MRIAGVAAVLAVSRVAALAGHSLVWSWWSPIAYLWQDAIVMLAYAAIELAVRPARRTAWIMYIACVAYIAVGVPVTRVMSTPMTWTMWRAAGGALSDSILLYVTTLNLLWVAAVVAAGLLPLCVRSGSTFVPLSLRSGFSFVSLSVGSGFSRTYRPLFLFAMLGVAMFGPTAVRWVDTRGLDRNAWSTLVMTAVPRMPLPVPTLEGPPDEHAGQAPTDLTRFRGAASGRHVILVSLESTAAQYLSLYGAAYEAMPNLSALARSAIVFDRAYAVYPESIKGLFSILCSVYPVFDRAADASGDVPCRSIASHLGARGYRSALFHSGRFGYLGMDAVVRNRGFDVLADAGDIGGRHESSFGVDDRATVDRILTWIDALLRGERFFVAYLPIAGHHPYESPEGGPFPAGDDFGRYKNALHFGDAALGDLITGLAQRQLSENILWIVVADHGEAFGQHDGNFGHTFQLYEENVRVPFLIAAPGLLARQTRSSRIVSLIDTAPTILDMLHLPVDDAYQGKSVLATEPRTAVFYADYSMRLLGLREGNLKYIYEIDSKRSRLFDLEHDPLETRDIAAGSADAVRDYARRLRIASTY